MKFKYLIAVSVLITGTFLVLNAYLSSTGNFKCTNTESAVLKEFNKVPDATKAFKVQDRKDKIKKLCDLRPKVCGPATTDQTPRVLEICQSDL